MSRSEPSAALLLAIAAVTALAPAATAEPEIQFDRQVRPVLSNGCFKCHGPDAVARKAGLRLDRFEDATAPLPSGARAIVPGDSAASAIIQRLTAHDELDRMPPSSETRRPTAEQIELVRRWIDQGARWQEHWSFVAPARRPLPETSSDPWVANPIDAFVLRRLREEGLEASPPADRRTLIRRVTLDLTGLPPAPDEIDDFLADDTPGAYERLVDRLLASPRYGEHMARFWLDAARYGDTHGLHLDNRRDMWRWRDWVIGAYNDNMPFDRFTIEQLAGDLLPEPTTEQLIATGFNRNNVTTSEGGAIDAEYLVKYAVDRVETTSTVWMGLTAGCAVCHDHKFDPISQREFYGLFAFFNNITENAMDGNQPAPPPVIRAPTPEQAAELEAIGADIAALEARLDAPMPEVDAAQAVWEQQWRASASERWEVLDPTAFASTGGSTLEKLDDGSLLAGGTNPDRDLYEITARTDRTGLTIVRLDALTHPSLPHNGPGRAKNANLVLSEVEAEAVSVADGSSAPLRFVAATADHEQMNGPFLAEHTIDGVVDDTNGWAVEGFTRREDRTLLLVTAEPFGFAGGTELRFRLRFETHFEQHAIGRVRLSVSGDEEVHDVLAPSALGPWHEVGPFYANDGNEAFKMPFGPEQEPGDVNLSATYRDGELAWVERPGYADGEIHSLAGERCAVYLHRTIDAPSGRPMELSLGSDDAIKVWLNGRVVLERNVRRPVAADQEKLLLDLEPGLNRLLMKIVNESGEFGFYFRKAGEGADRRFIEALELLAADPRTLTPEQRTLLRRNYRRHRSPELKTLYARLQERRDEEADYVAMLPTTLVMQERDGRRETFVLRRGEYDQPLDAVEPGVPAVLPALSPRSAGGPADRLDLARWLVSDEHPLTARAAVNRYWQMHFGTGLVATVEDLGSQGEPPSHPDLLDWLARRFVDGGWDVKAMHRLIVTSATYRQSSRLSPELQRRDPGNRLLARASRFRLDAEVIRDQALVAGGLLVEHLGGPSVRPYQPMGLWRDVAYTDSNTSTFEQDEGDALYRRSLYTFWKRTSPPPSLQTFDAPTRETCTVRRPRTNTPLQSLVLLNDPQFVEAARAIGRRMMLEAGQSPQARMALGFRLVTGRRPDSRETSALLEAYAAQLQVYAADPESAAALLEIGDSAPEPSLDPVQLAACANVASVILSLDEALTRE